MGGICLGGEGEVGVGGAEGRGLPPKGAWLCEQSTRRGWAEEDRRARQRCGRAEGGAGTHPSHAHVPAPPPGVILAL